MLLNCHVFQAFYFVRLTYLFLINAVFFQIIAHCFYMICSYFNSSGRSHFEYDPLSILDLQAVDLPGIFISDLGDGEAVVAGIALALGLDVTLALIDPDKRGCV